MARSGPDRAGDGMPGGGFGRVAALALGVFAVGTGQFVLAGLLPLLVDAFGVTVARAGQVVTVFALTSAVSAPVLTTLTAAWRRRTVLVNAAAVYLLGAVLTALAGSFGQVIVAQAVAATGMGLFIPNASVTAAALVPTAQRGRAIAVVVSGFTAAVALGAPLGTALGGLLGWRATLWFTTGLAVLGLVGVGRFVPGSLRIPSTGGLRSRLRPLGDLRVLALLATTFAAFTAAFIPYTYIAVVYAPAIGGSTMALALLMFAGGVAGAVGNVAAGIGTDRFGGARVVAFALGCLAIGLVLAPLTTGHYGASLLVVAFYAMAAFAVTAPQQHRLIALKPEAAPVVLSWNQCALYLAIAMSGLVGAVGIGWLGPRFVTLLAAAFVLLALGSSVAAHRLAIPARGDTEVVRT